METPRLGNGFGKALCLDGPAMAPTIWLFAYLQVLDCLTTLIGFKLGAGEASPFVRFLVSLGPVVGLLLSKVLAFALAGACVFLQRPHVLRWANCWFASLVVWNTLVLLQLPGPGAR